MPGRSALPPSGPRSSRFATDGKRKEHPEPLVGSDEYKRRKFPLSNMVARTSGSLFETGSDEDDRDEGKVEESDAEYSGLFITDSEDEHDRDEGKSKNCVQREISRLRAEIEGHKRKKQDMLFDLLQEQQRRAATESNLRLEQVRNAHSFAAWQVELRSVKEDLKMEHMRRLRAEAATKEDLKRELAMRQHAQAAMDALNAEVEHLQEVNATMMSDLSELRELENEVAAKQKDEHLGLPPAYGNLNDEDRFPPYSTHEDGGMIEVAHLKREIRQSFEVIVNNALISEVEKRSKLELFGTLAGGLSKACFSLRKLLSIAPSVPVSCVRKPTDYGGHIESQLRSLTDSIHGERGGPGNKSLERKHPKFMNNVLHHEPYVYLPGYAIMQRENSAPYVADRIAKLILELLWRFVTACEIRPGAGTSPNAERTSQLLASIMLHFTQVDLVLLKALQLAFSHKTSTTKLQYHLTQLQELNKLCMSQMFGQLAARRFLARTRLWLNEQVEKERAACTCMDCRAAVAAHPELFAVPYGDRNNDDSENDGVSSRWEGSDAGSGENDVEDEGDGLWPDDNPRLSESPGDFEVEDGYWG
jgi:hypothetical protein